MLIKKFTGAETQKRNPEALEVSSKTTTGGKMELCRHNSQTGVGKKGQKGKNTQKTQRKENVTGYHGGTPAKMLQATSFIWERKSRRQIKKGYNKG